MAESIEYDVDEYSSSTYSASCPIEPIQKNKKSRKDKVWFVEKTFPNAQMAKEFKKEENSWGFVHKRKRTPNENQY